MDVLGIILGLIVFAVFIIFVWEMIKSMLLETMFNEASIDEVKEYINAALQDANFYEYDMLFRTPDCKAYKKFNLHIAKTKDSNKEVIMIDLD